VAIQSSVQTVRLPDESIQLASRWRLSSRADPALLARLAWIQNICLMVAASIAVVILSAWLIPSLPSSILFDGWMLMKANTAALILLSASSLGLSGSHERLHKSGRILVAQVLAAVVFLVAAAVLVQYIGGVSLGIDTLLAADKSSPQPGRMSPQTAAAFLLLGSILFFIPIFSRITGLIVDLLVFCLCPLVMVVVAGYAFGVIRLFGVSPWTRTSPQTLLALMLLSFVAFSRRSQAGFYSILAGVGIGSKIARIASPVILVVPFILEAIQLGVSQSGLLSRQYATALAAALAAVAGFVVILLLAWRMDSLEQEVRDLSLRDELTRLYNRRGFFLLAERELRLAQRSHVPFSVLFLDLDGLKAINDNMGHEVGSDFLRETAELILQSSRESDVAGRIGGDEFVIAGVASEAGISELFERLKRAVALRNAAPGHPFPLDFSVGMATLKESSPESLDEMLKRADEAMYIAKQTKGRARQ
jgi:diguanylate cyclase (GGDEF)-like protein